MAGLTFPEGYRTNWTALVTPFNERGEIDWKGLYRNLDFQLACGMNPLSVGTTGECPTLGFEEHIEVNRMVIARTKGKSIVMTGTGGNSTKEAMHLSRPAVECGADALLLVDCYYNGPSSKEMREGYYEVIAGEFPGVIVIPYIIPGRTGTELGVEDLAILNRRCPNVIAVKEASGDLETNGRMVATRRELGDSFYIFSGDDDKTYEMMTRSDIRAQGVISVASNVAPKAVAEMTQAIRDGNMERADYLGKALAPLFGTVTVKTVEDEYNGFKGVKLKFRNPTPIKTLMRGLGMPSGPCRQPLGRMTPKGVDTVRSAIRTVYEKNPEILMPLAEFYGIDLSERIGEDRYWL